MQDCYICNLPARLCSGPKAHQGRRQKRNDFKEEFSFYGTALSRLTNEEFQKVRQQSFTSRWRWEYIVKELKYRTDVPWHKE